MFLRLYSRPKRSFFLFGPRGTGKTTWLHEQFPGALRFDLLRTSEFLRLSGSPDIFRKEVESLPSKSWVVVDEVQRLPTLLNEVHSIMADTRNRYLFALTGSSARKLKRTNVNLLAGRAIQRAFFPLTGEELAYDYETDDLIQFGCLPLVRSEPRDAVDILEAYIDTYLRQEIKEEAIVRKLEPFSRFLEISALANAQVTNLSNIARDTGVSRPSVTGYFEALVDTLLGNFLPAWRARAKIKEIAHSKFYFFDTGVVRALSRRLRAPLHPSERGHLLETLLYHELKTWTHVHQSGAEISYWRTPHGNEIDFIIGFSGKRMGVEVKASTTWKPEFSRTLKEMLDTHVIQKGIGVYLGERALRDKAIHVFPLKAFQKELARNYL